MQATFINIARSAKRRGYTLFEVLLVMAIVISVMTAAVPIFRNSFEVERLRKGADVVRTAWTKARVQAMTSGQTHVFRFEYTSNQYVIAVWDMADAAADVSSAAAVERPGLLPEGIVFHAAEKVAEARSADADAAGGGTAPQIFFYPDGTTSTAQLLITNSKQERFLKVQLRGLTGIPHVGDVVSADELQLEGFENL